MSQTVKGTRTEENLKEAFAGESQANRRYLYFANLADVNGDNDVASVFRSTAEGETGHAHFHERIFNIKEWPKFKKIHWLIYEDIITDWQRTGQILGFDDWTSDSDKHYLGYGPVWDKVINKKEVLDWVQELQINYRFTTEKEKYKL